MLLSKLCTFGFQKKFCNNNNREAKDRKLLLDIFIKFSKNRTKTLEARNNNSRSIFCELWAPELNCSKIITEN